MDAMNPDLSKFIAHGGKLIQYHGWADPQISPGSSVAYYQSVVEKLGPAKVQQNYRLFMVPGMAHCGGGDGTSTFDMLTALEQWVERGRLRTASRHRGSAMGRRTGRVRCARIRRWRATRGRGARTTRPTSCVEVDSGAGSQSRGAKDAIPDGAEARVRAEWIHPRVDIEDE